MFFISEKVGYFKERGNELMTCIHCGYEGPKTSFRYLYNVRLEESAANRECPKCFGWVMVDERTGEVAPADVQGKVPGADLGV